MTEGMSVRSDRKIKVVGFRVCCNRCGAARSAISLLRLMVEAHTTHTHTQRVKIEFD